MATEKFVFTAEVKGFIDGINKMKASAAQGVKGLGADIGGWVTAIRGAGATIVGTLGSTFETLKGFADSAGKVETLSTRFSVLQGSAKKAGQTIEYLRDFAAKTPFSLDELASADATLLSFTGDAEKSKVVLKQLGDISAATGAKVGELASIYGKIGAVGKMDTEAVNQFSERGINVREMLAARDGLSGTQVQKNIEKGAYGQQDLDYILEKLTSEGGMAFGAMEKLSETYDGLMSTLGDNIEQLKQMLGEELLPHVKEALEGLIGYIQNHKDEAQAFGIALRQGVTTAVDVMKWNVETWGNAASGVLKTGSGLVDYITRLLTFGQGGTNLLDDVVDPSNLMAGNRGLVKSQNNLANTEAELAQMEGTNLVESMEELIPSIGKTTNAAALQKKADELAELENGLSELKSDTWGEHSKAKASNIKALEEGIVAARQEIEMRSKQLEAQKKASAAAEAAAKAEEERKKQEEKDAKKSAEDAAKRLADREKEKTSDTQKRILNDQQRMSMDDQWSAVRAEADRLGVSWNADEIDSSISRIRDRDAATGGTQKNRIDFFVRQLQAALDRGANYDETKKRYDDWQKVRDGYAIDEEHGRRAEAEVEAKNRMDELIKAGFTADDARKMASEETGFKLAKDNSARGYAADSFVGSDLSRIGGGGKVFRISDPMAERTAKATEKMADDAAAAKEYARQISDRLASIDGKTASSSSLTVTA